MKASTTGVRVLILCDGTMLVPTKPPVLITDREAVDQFTTILAEKREIVLVGEQAPQAPQAPQAVDSPLVEKLSAMTKSELVDLLEKVGIEEKERTSKDVLIAKLVEYEEQNQ